MFLVNCIIFSIHDTDINFMFVYTAPVTSESNDDIDYSQCDCSKAYNIMVRCSVKLSQAMSQDPETLATALHAEGFIAQFVLDQTTQLNEIRSSKGNRLYSAVLGKVKCVPMKFAKFVLILRRDGEIYNDVLEEMDKVYRTL